VGGEKGRAYGGGRSKGTINLGGGGPGEWQKVQSLGKDWTWGVNEPEMGKSGRIKAPCCNPKKRFKNFERPLDRGVHSVMEGKGGGKVGSVGGGWNVIQLWPGGCRNWCTTQFWVGKNVTFEKLQRPRAGAVMGLR